MSAAEAAPRAALYFRISEDKEGREVGVERQQIDSRALAARRGLTVVAEYTDNDISASTASTKPRPNYDAMIESIRAGEVDVVVAYSSSRITRRPREWEDLIELNEETGFLIATAVGGDIDLSTAAGRRMARINYGISAGEAEETRERIHRANRHRVEVLGEPTNGVRYGWRRGLGGAMELDPEAAQVVQEIARRIVAGESLNSIKKDLTARAVPTARMAEIANKARDGSVGDQTSRGVAAEVVTEVAERTVSGEALTDIVADLRDRRARFPQWSHGSLTSLVRRPANVARIEYQGATYPGKFPAILDDDTFEQVNLILGDPGRTRRPAGLRHREIRNWLVGVAVCGKLLPDGTECRGRTRVTAPSASKTGRRYATDSSHRSYNCAECHGTSVRTHHAEAAVREVVLAYLEDPRTPALLSGDPAEVAAQEARIAGLTERRRRIARAYADGAYDDAEYADLLRVVDADLADARARLADAGPRPELTRWLDGEAAEAWDDATPGEKRDLVAALMTVVILPGGRGRKAFNPRERLRIEPKVPGLGAG
ncbi:recombinase family protein [Isoptericola hypogeus]|uniref:Recombinase family protein n=1 Tax=Isoptericola hypogeus TaxID=300179 RepID=A0ABN2IYF3_9MICO